MQGVRGGAAEGRASEAETATRDCSGGRGECHLCPSPWFCFLAAGPRLNGMEETEAARRVGPAAGFPRQADTDCTSLWTSWTSSAGFLTHPHGFLRYSSFSGFSGFNFSGKSSRCTFNAPMCGFYGRRSSWSAT